MFVRMLKLPQDTRDSFDVSSLEHVLHAGAPCPVWAKHDIMAWWGPILFEYYGGTETGMTYITADEWLAHPGSVGRSPRVHVVDDAGDEVAPFENGIVYFDSGASFQYHNDPAKTKESYDARGWATLGDIGYLDDDGYLFLTDRKAYMIISGGVNIYPQETENALLRHPAIADVAVFGVPDDVMGESVHAVVQLEPGYDGDDEMAAAIIAFCRDSIAHFKCPRTLAFIDVMPRLETGKLLKRTLRDDYLAASSTSTPE
jgi:acyl-CoA synthetase (AMP-forming)/AMP-acid ligase II